MTPHDAATPIPAPVPPPDAAETLQLLQPSEVAIWLGLHRRTVIRFLREGRLPGLKIGGKWFAVPEAIEAMVAVVKARPASGCLTLRPPR